MTPYLYDITLDLNLSDSRTAIVAAQGDTNRAINATMPGVSWHPPTL